MRSTEERNGTVSMYPALLLNADYMPLSRRPLSTLGMHDVIKDVFLDRVVVLEEYDKVIRSAGGKFQMNLPSVVALKEYQSQNHIAPFTRMGVLLRERGRCGYCGNTISRKTLTFDHVHPRSKGGETSWQNVVASCSSCNTKKANKLLSQCGMKLNTELYAPTKMKLNALAADMPMNPRYIHKTWRMYLGMDNMEDPTQEKDSVGTGLVFPNGMTSEQYWDAELES